uniref:Uncharacterized protein n=1 Tax=Kalanchoe fedtschenkoi TaxID=63787 RepID=A0A7N0UDL0_KALFE
MSRSTQSLLGLLLLLVLYHTLPSARAEIKFLKIESDSRPVILLERFGFTRTGRVSISLSSVSVFKSPNTPPPTPSRLGFFLISDEAVIQTMMESNDNPDYFCVLDSQYIVPLFTFEKLSPPPHASLDDTINVDSPNEYSLFFANCNPQSSVSMTVRTEMYNLDNGVKDYLSAGQTQLPTLYFLFGTVYVAFLAGWIYICLKNKLNAHRIHALMGLLVLMKALNLLCAAEDKHYVKVTGKPHGWDVLFYIFQTIRVVLLFTVIVLIGTGWSFLKPFLQEKEKKVLMIVIPLQVVANLASVVMGETGPFIKDWVMWNQIFLLVDIICCCAILFPIIWSIRSLKETSKTDGKAAKNLAKLTLFRQFYTVVIAYLYFTRIVVFALRTIAAYKYQWVSNAAEEVASLVFYCIMFHMFRPVEKNEYFAIDDDEEEVAMAALRDDDFEI